MSDPLLTDLSEATVCTAYCQPVLAWQPVDMVVFPPREFVLKLIERQRPLDDDAAAATLEQVTPARPENQQPERLGSVAAGLLTITPRRLSWAAGEKAARHGGHIGMEADHLEAPWKGGGTQDPTAASWRTPPASPRNPPAHSKTAGVPKILLE